MSGWPSSGQGGKYRSSVDAREPRNPTKSEEYQKHLQGVLYIEQSERDALRPQPRIPNVKQRASRSTKIQ
eukprot:5831327-Pyramimonas_sp.AAC.1